ncbi:MAG: cbb3-type cytochrome oxidase assembly protein CcoS [Arenicellales bacterium]|nr:cbb3-type cytochrome oxidase assembly protein CcoS [Arenicellales bacterium]MDP6792249.1 cbb3-type cytochrome oxidase assembly protein CcoS [Arenicellales bacterium]
MSIDIVFFLIPLALILVSVAIWGFFWAVSKGRFEDLQGPGHAILLDEDEKIDASYKTRHKLSE